MNSLEITSAMAEVEEVEGSGLMEDREESLEHVQQWDEDVVDLEFKSGHKTPFLGQFNLDERYLRWNSLSSFDLYSDFDTVLFQ